jgi:hypothetical protein
MIAAFDEMMRQNPGQALPPEASQLIDQSRQLLAKGIALKIDTQSGLIVQYGAPQRQTAITNFRWLERINPAEFAVERGTWEDFTDDPTRGDRDELLMIAHNALWRPGMKSPDTDGRLLEIKTGRVRRIPFQGAVSEPGCFLKGRDAVVVCGLDPEGGVLGLYEVNLSTGANRPLGGPVLASGFTLFPQLSPDGKTLVAIHSDGDAGVLRKQACLVDLETGKATLIGAPRDLGPTAWMPDGQALLTIDREDAGPSKPTVNTICRMDLEGRLTRLREGNNAVILGAAKRILFDDASDRMWKTCDYSGKDVTVFAGGLKGHAFPAPAPDGKRLLLMRFESGKAPAPMIYTIGETKGTAATSLPGLWAHPAWR